MHERQRLNEFKFVMAGVRLSSNSRPRRTPVPLTRSQMGAEILETLRERILNWHYPPGAHLGEQAICDEFASSRIPVREALRALAAQDLVEQVPNSGCYVKQPDAVALQQLYEHRLALELFVMERLAQRGLPLELAVQLHSHWEPIARADMQVDDEGLIEADEAFHLKLARAIENPHILRALEEINVRLRFVRRVVLTTPSRMQQSAADHLRILAALENKDAPAARQALSQHIHYALSKVELALSGVLDHAQRKRSE